MKTSRIHIVHDRQIQLANLRTFLAFLRTSLACWGFGVALLHLINEEPYKTLGVIFIVLGCATFIWGIGEYHFIQKSYIRDIEEYDGQ